MHAADAVSSLQHVTGAAAYTTLTQGYDTSRISGSFKQVSAYRRRCGPHGSWLKAASDPIRVALRIDTPVQANAEHRFLRDFFLDSIPSQLVVICVLAAYQGFFVGARYGRDLPDANVTLILSIVQLLNLALIFLIVMRGKVVLMGQKAEVVALPAHTSPGGVISVGGTQSTGEGSGASQSSGSQHASYASSAGNAVTGAESADAAASSAADSADRREMPRGVSDGASDGEQSTIAPASVASPASRAPTPGPRWTPLAALTRARLAVRRAWTPQAASRPRAAADDGVAAASPPDHAAIEMGRHPASSSIAASAAAVEVASAPAAAASTPDPRPPARQRAQAQTPSLHAPREGPQRLQTPSAAPSAPVNDGAAAPVSSAGHREPNNAVDSGPSRSHSRSDSDGSGSGLPAHSNSSNDVIQPRKPSLGERWIPDRFVDCYVSRGWKDFHWSFTIFFEGFIFLLGQMIACGKKDVQVNAVSTVCRAFQEAVFPLPPTLAATIVAVAVNLVSAKQLYSMASISAVYFTVCLQNGLFYPGTGGDSTRRWDVAIGSLLLIMSYFANVSVAIVLARNRRRAFGLFLSLDGKFREYAQAVREWRASQASLIEAKAAELKANTSKQVSEATIGYAAHQLRNPLHMLTTLISDLALRPGLSNDVIDDVMEMSGAVAHMTRITDDVLAYQRLMSGRVQLVLQPVNVRKLVGRLVSQFGRRAGRDITVVVAADVPDECYMDPIRVSQMLANGIANAVSYTPTDGTISLHIWRVYAPVVTAKDAKSTSAIVVGPPTGAEMSQGAPLGSGGITPADAGAGATKRGKKRSPDTGRDRRRLSADTGPTPVTGGSPARDPRTPATGRNAPPSEGQGSGSGLASSPAQPAGADQQAPGQKMRWYLHIEVRNTDGGLKGLDPRTLFTPFLADSDLSAKKRLRSTGLGLPIVRLLAGLVRGRVGLYDDVQNPVSVHSSTASAAAAAAGIGTAGSTPTGETTGQTLGADVGIGDGSSREGVAGSAGVSTGPSPEAASAATASPTSTAHVPGSLAAPRPTPPQRAPSAHFVTTHFFVEVPEYTQPPCIDEMQLDEDVGGEGGESSVADVLIPVAEALHAPGAADDDADQIEGRVAPVPPVASARHMWALEAASTTATVSPSASTPGTWTRRLYDREAAEVSRAIDASAADAVAVAGAVRLTPRGWSPSLAPRWTIRSPAHRLGQAAGESKQQEASTAGGGVITANLPRTAAPPLSLQQAQPVHALTAIPEVSPHRSDADLQSPSMMSTASADSAASAPAAPVGLPESRLGPGIVAPPPLETMPHPAGAWQHVQRHPSDGFFGGGGESADSGATSVQPSEATSAGDTATFLDSKAQAAPSTAASDRPAIISAAQAHFGRHGLSITPVHHHTPSVGAGSPTLTSSRHTGRSVGASPAHFDDDTLGSLRTVIAAAVADHDGSHPQQQRLQSVHAAAASASLEASTSATSGAGSAGTGASLHVASESPAVSSPAPRPATPKETSRPLAAVPFSPGRVPSPTAAYAHAGAAAAGGGTGLPGAPRPPPAGPVLTPRTRLTSLLAGQGPRSFVYPPAAAQYPITAPVSPGPSPAPSTASPASGSRLGSPLGPGAGRPIGASPGLSPSAIAAHAQRALRSPAAFASYSAASGTLGHATTHTPQGGAVAAQLPEGGGAGTPVPTLTRPTPRRSAGATAAAAAFAVPPPTSEAAARVASTAQTPSLALDAGATTSALTSSFASAAPGAQPCFGLRVLVVDDERTNRKVNERLCNRLGCTSTLLEDGDQVAAEMARATAEGHPYDIVLLDIVMKRVNGDAACLELRRSGVAIPIIAATGNASESDKDRYLSSGFSAVLAKPFTADDLSETLKMLGVSPKPRAAAAATAAGVGGTGRTSRKH